MKKFKTNYDFFEIIDTERKIPFLDLLYMSLFAKDEVTKDMYRETLRYKFFRYFSVK